MSEKQVSFNDANHNVYKPFNHVKSYTDKEMSGWGGRMRRPFGESTHAGQITKRPSSKDNGGGNRGEAQLGGNERCPVCR